MSKISIIIAQEYRNKVMKKSFILLTILVPVLGVLLIAGTLWMSQIGNDEEKIVAVVDHTGLYTDFIASLTPDVCTFDIIENVDEIGSALDVEASDGKEYRAVMIISDDLKTNPSAIAIFSEKQVPRELSLYVESVFSKYVEDLKIDDLEIPDFKEKIESVKSNITVQTVKMRSDGSLQTSDADIASAIGMIATMLIYLFIFISGSQVMSSVVQEKSNRIVEVMICSVKPMELMWGKIISVALVCLTQIALWVVLSMILGVATLSSMNIDLQQLTPTMEMAQQAELTDSESLNRVLMSLGSINWLYLLLMFVVYFIGGYLLYSAIFAALGAAVDNENDTSQFLMPVTVVVLFALYAGIYSANNPDGPLAFWCSIVPFTSPIVMMVRLPFDVPAWQIMLSLGVLAVTICGVVWLSSKIYRVGILMYGKKPSWKELVKWIKY